MSRQEFSKSTRREAMTRSNGLCEGILPDGAKCSVNLWQKSRHFDHIIPCGIGGTNELSNCQVLCIQCHGAKTQKIDIPIIAKARRVSDRHNGIRKPSRFPGSRDSRWKKKMNGEVVPRC
jgi:5-methylcytosine-specific restriction protein A